MVEEAYDTLNDESLLDLLDQYTEALVLGRDGGASVAARAQRTSNLLLTALFRTIKQLYRVLTPVRPSADFVSSLQADLERACEKRDRKAHRWDRLRERATSLSTVVGAVVSIVALVGLVVRVIGSIVLIVMFILRQRRSESAAAA